MSDSVERPVGVHGAKELRPTNVVRAIAPLHANWKRNRPAGLRVVRLLSQTFPHPWIRRYRCFLGMQQNLLSCAMHTPVTAFVSILGSLISLGICQDAWLGGRARFRGGDQLCDAVEELCRFGQRGRIRVCIRP